MKLQCLSVSLVTALVALATNMAPAQANLGKLPDGDYITQKSSNHQVLFRKRGKLLIGYDSIAGTDRHFCFYAAAQGNQIIIQGNAYEPKYSRHNVESAPKFFKGIENLNLEEFSELQNLDRRSHEFKVLVSCLDTYATWQKNQRTQLATRKFKTPKTAQNLPNGTHAYYKPGSGIVSEYIILAKHTNRVIGYYFTSHTDHVYCFDGKLQGNAVADVTNAEPRFGRGLSGFDLVEGQGHQLGEYKSISPSQVYAKFPKSRNSLQECLSIFKR